ncbi:MAG: hypothetical protein RL588_1049 [Pseudomonadota bacterium]|jgi:glutamyl-tRNA synthetase
MSERQVVTRIAPSPTGSMHIGTARTALFNWLYARRMGGKYLLRIEDTDRERSTEAAVKVILDGLNWLGLEPDETPVFQFARAERHREVALELLARGDAYRDYMTPDELAEERERARAEGRVVRSPWRDHDGPVDAGRPHVIRLRAPQEGETRIDDQVKGEVVFRNVDLDDLILLRTDGTPTYNLAVVVDDHDMGVTHVIRGDDHLNNAARQTHIYQAMGWDTPVWAHLPMIHGPDGKKLSKRHGAQAVSEFDDMGYLPEALRNYLAKLGWGHGDDEIFSDAQAQAWFDIRDVVGAPARQADPERLADLVEKVLKSRDWPVHDGDREILLRTLPLVRDGARTTLELADAVVFALRRRPLDLPEKARNLLTDETRARLGRLAARISESEWSVTALEATIRAFAEAEGVGIGKFGPALRAVLSGGSPAPDLAGALISIGKAESLARIQDALPN